ncbi:MAG: putative ATP-binding protein involved in virulence [Phenylobacterium sp.]|jgi:predicted ATP-binding protein involved in virulence
MDVTRFKMTNIGQFAQVDIPLAPTSKTPSNVTVLVGNNGSGKTSILTSMGISLSWLVAACFNQQNTGSNIAGGLIKKGQTSGSLGIEVTGSHNPNDTYHWLLSKTLDGNIAPTPALTPELTQAQANLAEVAKLADVYRSQFTEDNTASFPLIAFYTAERFVNNVALEIKKSPTGNQLAAYENALGRTTNFEQFFEWFREREDIENETASPIQLTEQLAFDVVTAAMKAAQVDISDDEIRTAAEQMISNQQNAENDKQLSAVRNAIKAFMPGLNNLRVRRSPVLHMSVEKAGLTFSVEQLSQGEKVLMALVGDIARRLAILNPSFDNPLHGDGIVLIDEADLHLHPQWQRTFIARLTQTFPNCQFVLTTHSPLLISDSKDVLCYLLDNGELEPIEDLYGLDANQVLLQVMNTDVRNSQVNNQINQLLSQLQSGHLEAAQDTFNQLSTELPKGHIELAKANLMIRKLELRREKNRQE